MGQRSISHQPQHTSFKKDRQIKKPQQNNPRNKNPNTNVTHQPHLSLKPSLILKSTWHKTPADKKGMKMYTCEAGRQSRNNKAAKPWHWDRRRGCCPRALESLEPAQKGAVGRKGKFCNHKCSCQVQGCSETLEWALRQLEDDQDD